MWAQAYNSAQMSFGGVAVCAYPTLADTIELATTLSTPEGRGAAVSQANAMAWDLARAWERICDDTLCAYPSPQQRRTPTDPAYWLTETGRSVRNIGRLEGKVQKILSRGLGVLQKRDVEAALQESRTTGWAERLQLFEASQTKQHGRPFVAQPWIDDGDMHWANSDLLVTTALRFGLDLQRSAVPRRHCPCKKFVGASLPAVVSGTEARAVAEATRREWARHALTCSKGAGKRTITHDNIQDVFIVLLKNAGFDDVVEEDVWWDAAAAYTDEDHRRPDITCRHPVTGEKLVFDIVVWWGRGEGTHTRGGARRATAREGWKRRRYLRSMWARYMEQLGPVEAVAWAADAENELGEEMNWDLVECPHRFIPLGFEAGGGFGQATLDFLQELVETAGEQSSADLYHWSAMVFGEHWGQRLSLVLARGQADLVLGAVAAGRNNNGGAQGRKASPEWSSTDCQPCVNL